MSIGDDIRSIKDLSQASLPLSSLISFNIAVGWMGNRTKSVRLAIVGARSGGKQSGRSGFLEKCTLAHLLRRNPTPRCRSIRAPLRSTPRQAAPRQFTYSLLLALLLARSLSITLVFAGFPATVRLLCLPRLILLVLLGYRAK